MIRPACCVGLLALASMSMAAAADNARVLDNFDDASPWQAAASDQVSATLRQMDGKQGRALCLDYDFNGVSGHAALRRELPIEFPANYQFDFDVLGAGRANQFEFKLIDASGENVWWVSRPKTIFPSEWTTTRYKARHISPAWGPLPDKTLRRTQFIEFTVYANEGGGGSLCVDELTFAELPVPPAVWPAPKVVASSGAAPQNLAASNASAPWRSEKTGEQTLVFDFGAPREIGGLVLDWLPREHAHSYDIELSQDGKTWLSARRVERGNGGTDFILLGEVESRYLRLAMHEGPGERYGLLRMDVRNIAFGGSANTFFEAIALREGAALYPRGFSGQQTYWTLVGIDGGADSGLISEDGALEVGRGGFSLQPFVVDGCGSDAPATLGWNDVDITQSLPEGYLPMPAVHWKRSAAGCDWSLDIDAFAQGTREDSRLLARYTLRNDSEQPRDLTLALAVQPFQVNPPVQFLTTPGGVSPIHALQIGENGVSVDGDARVFTLDRPTQAFVTPFEAGMAPSHLAAAALPADVEVNDASGFASGALLYRMALAPDEQRSVALEIPLAGAQAIAKKEGAAWVQQQREAVALQWHKELDRVQLLVPASEKALADTLRTALAHILINRDGVQIRPGTRSYARSWIRDGAMTSEALLRLGRDDAATAFLEWYAPFQFGNGKVPCCVDTRGADPVPENDSHGELIFLATEVVRYTGDLVLAKKFWPHVDKATRYLDTLRASERTPENQGSERFGLLPPSISHEGYSAKPAYSHWDNFWGLIGYKNAVLLAQMLGQANDAARLAIERDAFRADILASLQASAKKHGIAYLPGAADLGDFDATSTTIALSPGNELAHLPREMLLATFERYWTDFVARRDGKRESKDYTPYEWRNVSAFVRLGWRERAHEAIDFFFADRRPQAWNQWAEVVGKLEREPRFIGDMPHGWVASDFIRSALDLFAYERSEDRSLVLAAGVPSDWLDGEGTGIRGLRTPYGILNYTLRREGGRVLVKIDEGLRLPSGGLAIAWPLEKPPRIPSKWRKKVEWIDGELRIKEAPIEFEVRL